MDQLEQEIESLLRAEAQRRREVDVAAFLRAARRRATVRHRRLGLGIGAAVLAVSALLPVVLLPGAGGQEAAIPDATPAWTPPLGTVPCIPQALHLPESVASLLQSSEDGRLDRSGRFVLGVFWLVNDVSRLVLWDNGAPTELPAPPLPGHAGGTAVNARGDVVGYSTVSTSPSDETSRGWLYSGGSFTPLTVPAGFATATGSALNDAGTVVGTVQRDGGIAPARWTAGGTVVQLLSMPTGFSAGYAADIRDDGTVVGAVGTKAAIRGVEIEPRPYLWAPDGTGHFLDLPPGKDFGSAERIVGHFVLGIAQQGTTGTPVKVLWNLANGAISTFDDLLFVDAAGDLVRPIDGNVSGLTRDGQTYVLTPGDSSFVSPRTIPSGISDDGSVVLGFDATVDAPLSIWRC